MMMQGPRADVDRQIDSQGSETERRMAQRSHSITIGDKRRIIESLIGIERIIKCLRFFVLLRSGYYEVIRKHTDPERKRQEGGQKKPAG
jgi:hypothetical protein